MVFAFLMIDLQSFSVGRESKKMKRIMMSMIALLGIISCAGKMGDIQFTRKCTGKIVLVCEDKSTTKPFGELLSTAGFTVEIMSKKEKVFKAATSEADLVILTPMSRGTWGSLQWKRAQFEHSQGKKILAMGESGADFLSAGELLIGNPHGAHSRYLPKIVCIPTS